MQILKAFFLLASTGLIVSTVLVISGAALTASEHSVGAVVCVQAKDMKEPWCLATSLGGVTACEIVDVYARRWTVEPSFRDTKDIRFGTGMSLLRISRPDRRLLLNAFAVHLLTMLAPLARNSEWTATSGPAPANAVHIPPPARAACSTNSFLTCPKCVSPLYLS